MTSRFLATTFLLLAAGVSPAQEAAILNVVGARGKTVTLTITELKELLPRTIEVTDPHTNEKEAYQAVPLSKVLAIADVPFGTLLKGASLAATVRAEARDGYRVAFSLVELDQSISCAGVYVAFERGGQPLSQAMGPFRLLVPTDRRGARSIRQLTRVVLIE